MFSFVVASNNSHNIIHGTDILQNVLWVFWGGSRNFWISYSWSRSVNSHIKREL